VNMSSNRYNSFIYIDNKTKRVLCVKRTAEVDLTFNTTDFTCYLVVGPEPIFLEESLNCNYHPATGFTNAEERVSDIERLRFALLGRKIEVVQLMATRVHLAQKRIREMLHSRRAKSLAIDTDNFKILSFFYSEERAILIRASKKFFHTFLTDIEKANDMASVDRIFDDIRFNVNLMELQENVGAGINA
jgi:hypothetical protein